MVTSTLCPPWMGAHSSISGKPLATSASDMFRSATRRFLPSPTLGTNRFWMMTSLDMDAAPLVLDGAEPGPDGQPTWRRPGQGAGVADGRLPDLLPSDHDQHRCPDPYRRRPAPVA